MKFNTLLLAITISVSVKAKDNQLTNEPILPLPEVVKIDNLDKVTLGKTLFEDKRLSHNQTISCASCHNLNRGGVDGLVHSVGINGAEGNINSPSVFNSSFNFRQFWNGRAKNLNEQADGPIHNPKEMGSNWDEVVQKLKADKKYQSDFNKIYKGFITQENIKDAIVTFESSLVTVNSRFDQYLRGNEASITENELKGYQRFKSYGCVACHQGMNVGGNMFQTMGVMGDYFKDRKTPITEADLGRYSLTKDESDRYVFRVPSLRNVELTAPYFHDGSAKTLQEAVTVMAKYQLKRKLSNEEIDSIVAFLKSLTGETPASVKGVSK